MDNRDSTNVGAAFDILLESIHEEIQYINRLITESAARSEYEYIQALSSHASSVKDYQKEVEAMRDRWEQGFAQIPDVPQSVGQTVERPRELARSRQKRRDFGRLSDGSHTPPAEFMVPILEVLHEAGGRGRARDLMHAVHEKVSGRLKQVDYEGTTTQPDRPRWQNTAYYARQRLIKDGLVNGNSPVGEWELTERGRQELQRIGRDGQRS